MRDLRNNPNLTVVVATKNLGKLRGIEQAIDDTDWGSPKNISILASKTESGVANTPLSDEEGVLGCMNRLRSIKVAYPGKELYIAAEGVLAVISEHWFVRGWTVIEDAVNERTAIASGAGVQVPSRIARHICPDEQFSDTLARTYDLSVEEQHTMRDLGANGVFSNNAYGRRDTFYDGARICLAQLLSERNWDVTTTELAGQ